MRRIVFLMLVLSSMVMLNALLLTSTALAQKTNKIIKLYEDDNYFKFLLTGNDSADISDETSDVFNGQIAINVSCNKDYDAVQRYSPVIPGWNYKVVENPSKENEIRWIMFAWKKIGGTGIMVQFANNGEWGMSILGLPFIESPALGTRRYIAGDNLTGWSGIRVSKSIPVMWEVVIRDLFADFGEFTLTGIALTPFDNVGLFDSIYLGQNLKALNDLLVGMGKSSNKTILNISSHDLSPGSQITTQLKINDAVGVTSGDITIKYDPKILSVGDIKSTPLTSNINLTPNTDILGQIKIAMAGASAIPTGSGSLIDITFTVNPNVSIGTETTIQLVDTELYDEIGKVIPMNFENGTIKIIQPCVKGDVNNDGNIKSNDAMLILRIAVGLLEPNDYQRCAADVNGDGNIRSNDATIVLRKAAGLEAPSKDIITDRYISISLSEAHGLKGETISVPITVDNIDILSSGDMSISYDSKVLRAIDVLSSDDILMAENITQPGLIRISFANADILNNGNLAEIKFEVLTDDVSPLTFKMVELYNHDALPLNTKFTNRQFRSLAIAPDYSALLQNYPNPFNPETWIPYQLSESSDVEIRIHNIAGELVRELRLGHKPAGIYMDRDRAAYWDGRNEAGESVASGIYFYNIQAGEYSATKKMIIMQ